MEKYKKLNIYLYIHFVLSVKTILSVHQVFQTIKKPIKTCKPIFTISMYWYFKTLSTGIKLLAPNNRETKLSEPQQQKLCVHNWAQSFGLRSRCAALFLFPLPANIYRHLAGFWDSDARPSHASLAGIDSSQICRILRVRFNRQKKCLHKAVAIRNLILWRKVVD